MNKRFYEAPQARVIELAGETLLNDISMEQDTGEVDINGPGQGGEGEAKRKNWGNDWEDNWEDSDF